MSADQKSTTNTAASSTERSEDHEHHSNEGVVGTISGFVHHLADEGAKLTHQAASYIRHALSGDEQASASSTHKAHDPYDENALNDAETNWQEVKLTGLDVATMLKKEDVPEFGKYLPKRMCSWEWKLVYNAELHGSSSETFHRKVAELGGATLTIIRDRKGAVFGCFASEPWKKTGKEHYYGSGECFLFKKADALKVYKWTGKNEFFMMGLDHKDAIIMGGGADGHFGLYVDEAFVNGSSTPCETFGNEILSSERDFEVADIEVWGFVAPPAEARRHH